MTKRKNNKGFWQYKREIVVALLVILIVVFLYQNSEKVDFKLIFWTLHIPLIVLVLSFFALGALIAWGYNFFKSQEGKRELKRLKAELENIMKETKTLNKDSEDNQAE